MVYFLGNHCREGLPGTWAVQNAAPPRTAGQSSCTMPPLAVARLVTGLPGMAVHGLHDPAPHFKHHPVAGLATGRRSAPHSESLPVTIFSSRSPRLNCRTPAICKILPFRIRATEHPEGQLGLGVLRISGRASVEKVTRVNGRLCAASHSAAMAVTVPTAMTSAACTTSAKDF